MRLRVCTHRGAYGPVVLAGLLGREGITPAAQIIKNKRESGTMLNVPVPIPALLAPCFRASHERYVLYWQLT